MGMCQCVGKIGMGICLCIRKIGASQPLLKGIPFVGGCRHATTPAAGLCKRPPETSARSAATTPRTARLLWRFFALAFAASAAGAQSGYSRVTGRVVDRSTKAPIVGARITHTPDGRSVVTDSTGAFAFANLPAGVARLVVRAPGFPSAPLFISLASGETKDRIIELDSTDVAGRGAQPLPAVPVTAPASLGPRFADFERRKATGRGHYLTRQEIEKSGFYSLQDAVRGMRGVNVECGGGIGCYIRMARAPMHCQPDYVVDERVDNSFGPATPIRDIEALEVYTGPSDVPGEFAGRSAGCGVIVIWTRAGPPRRRP